MPLLNTVADDFDPFADDQKPPVRLVKPEPPKPAPTTTPQRAPLDWPTLANQEPPARRWAIKGWFGFGHTTLLVGQGGIGKTLLAQQAASCIAIGRDFIDEVNAPHRVLMWACEDDHDELWRRQIAISHWMKLGLDEYAGNLVIVPRHGLDNAIVTTEYGKLQFTPGIEHLREQAADLDAQVVILDNVAQLYGGSENDRHSVTAFLNGLAGALPDRAVLLLAHPSRGANSEFSGSSAWENVARTRLYLGATLPDQKAPEDDGQAQDVRYLSRRKSNYSNKDYRRCTYRDGVLVPDEAENTGGVVSAIRSSNAEKVVITGLKKLLTLGLNPTDGSTSPRYLPRMLNEYKLTEGFSRADLADAVRRLMLEGSLRKVTRKGDDRHPINTLDVPQGE